MVIVYNKRLKNGRKTLGLCSFFVNFSQAFSTSEVGVMFQGASLRKLQLILLFIFPLNISAMDCDKRTTEYIELRTKAYDDVKLPYKKCVSSIKEAIYWKAVAYCVSDATANSRTECEKLVEDGHYPKESVDISYCKSLEATFEEFEALLRSRKKKLG
ncbi:hypothetical protein AC626_08460 [Pseudoalteromonas rubra]|uniref:Uncharacterized protein n=1 Tax=Pseudoalteromonas rubra TaxID=43658 RepID=A0A0L0ETI6_9GAMM|nr:hypothetical protein AC626_08460 [Pseudoalteromonas rubra]